jgi:hypothetical protein
MRQTCKGKITISRPQLGDHKEFVRVTLKDIDACMKFLEVDVPLGQFALALTGMSEQECDLHPNRLDTVGKVREMEPCVFVLTQEYMDRHKLSRYYKEEIRQHMVLDPEGLFRQTDGWELSIHLGYQTSITSNHPDGIRINTYRVRYIERQES